MKKLLGIVVLGLLWCNTAFAALQIFTISCEGKLMTSSSEGVETVIDYYEDLEIYVGNEKSISTIKISPSHWLLRFDTYIPEESNNPDMTGLGDLIKFDASQSILIMKSPKNITSKDKNFKLLDSTFRLSLIDDSLNGYIFHLKNDNGIKIKSNTTVKSKCVGTEKIKKYLNIN